MNCLPPGSITYLVLPLALAACVVPTSLGDNPGDDTTAGTGDDATGGTGDDQATTAETGAAPATESGDVEFTTTTSDFTTTTADGPLCPNPAQMCGEIPLDCTEHNCGGLGSPFDADGCLRQACDGDNPCGADEVCFGDELAGCSPTVIGCDIEDGACECSSSDDCGGRYCYPEGEAPPADCGSFTDQASCLAAGCSDSVPATPMKLVDGACVCDAQAAICVWSPGGLGGLTIPGPFFNIASQEVVLFFTTWTPPPYGWSNCDEPGAPPACACASDCR